MPEELQSLLCELGDFLKRPSAASKAAICFEELLEELIEELQEALREPIGRHLSTSPADAALVFVACLIADEPELRTFLPHHKPAVL